MFKLKTFACCISALIPLSGAFSLYANTAKDVPNDIIVSIADHHDVSLPLRSIEPTVNMSVMQSMQQVLNNQHAALKPPTPTLIPLTGFQGIGVGLGSYVVNNVTPDPSGSVGMTQYVQWADKNIAVFDKRTGNLAAGFQKLGNKIWSGFGGPCETSNTGIATVKHDQLAKRWVLTQHAYSNSSRGPFYLCLAVSNTEDATGSYHRYSFKLDSRIDYARFGLWSDAYYMAFNSVTGSYKGALACALDRNRILAGRSATMQCKKVSSTQKNRITPADLDGATLPKSGNPGYFIGLKSPAQLIVNKFFVDFSNSNNTRIETVTIPVASFTQACSSANGNGCAIQPNTTNRLHVYSDRLMNRLSYRQFANYGVLLATHTVDGPPPKKSPAIRWYELHVLPNDPDCTPDIYQQATFTPNSMSRFLGSIAMDKLSNIAIGYNITSSVIYPSLELAMHRSADPLNTMTRQPLVTGRGSQINNESNWGSVSGMSIDPLDNCTFWYTGEYLKQTGSRNWSTFIMKFKLAAC